MASGLLPGGSVLSQAGRSAPFGSVVLDHLKIELYIAIATIVGAAGVCTMVGVAAGVGTNTFSEYN